MCQAAPGDTLKREIGLWESVVLGLGSIIGTGVFISLALAAEVAGYGLFLGVIAAAVLAYLNATSSAQLAANFPVSGGTYEYGYRTLGPKWGFTAGTFFLLAKSASAATAALGFSQYLIAYFQLQLDPSIVAPITVLGLTAIVFLGLRKSNRVVLGLVVVTFLTLISFVVLGLSKGQIAAWYNFSEYMKGGKFMHPFELKNTAYATALIFVAYTGYGRIATLGEEVIEPQKTIPRAILITLGLALVTYFTVALALIAVLGIIGFSQSLANNSAPLEAAARFLKSPAFSAIVSIGAMTAILSVLLNLILGLSRVLLAMGRRSDIPKSFAKLDSKQVTPSYAVVAVGVTIAGLAATQSLKSSWAFSAMNVLIYYSLTNLCALQLTDEQRTYPRLLSWAGLIGCLFLVLWIDWILWPISIGLLIVGFIIRAVFRKLNGADQQQQTAQPAAAPQQQSQQEQEQAQEPESGV